MYKEFLDWNFSSAGDEDLSPAKRIVFRILFDMSDRRGLRDEWDGIDEETKDEIIEEWIGLAEECLTR